MPYLIILTALLFIISACNSTGDNTETTPPTVDTVTVNTDAEEHVEYHPNGLVSIKGQKVNGKREGLWVSYYEDGKKWSETNFLNGVKSGRTRTYYENGMMRYSGQYQNDERTGVWKFYNEDGILEKTLDMSAEISKTP